MISYHHLPDVLFFWLFTAARDKRASPVWTCEPCQLMEATCFPCNPVQLWCTVALEAPSAALLPGVIAGRTLTLLLHFQRVIEISRGDNVSGSHDSCLDIAGGWRQQPLFVFQPLCLFQYSIYITSTRPSRVVSPFINCSKAKQTWATHSSSRSSWFLIVSLICFTNTFL